MMLSLIWLAFCLVSLTHSVHAASHVVSLPHSKYSGTSLSNGVSQWLGIPFAAPPVGELRFAPPINPPAKSGIQSADTEGPLCIATGKGAIPAGQSEDCLYLAVYAPTSATPASKLPVFVFIQGGGFNSDANPNLNGTGLVQASGNNIIVVTFNYRVGPWGFLASASAGVSNNGLRDQRKALEWVQRYISAFGGDPGHVVIGGDSAGAASVSLHMTAFGGRNDNLFHAAAAESVSFATVLTPAESQYQLDALSKSVGCDHDKSLECLRSKSAADIEAQNYNIPYPGQKRPPLYMFNPTLDNDFITDLTYNAFAKGKFVNVPVIFGDDTNGGTVFVPKDTASQADSDSFLTSQFPYLTSDELDQINKLYPKPDQCPLGKCWWRQASNAYGEMRYMCPGLYISSAVANVTSSASSKKSTRNLAKVGGGSLRVRTSASTNQHKTLTDSISAAGGKSWAYLYNVEDPDQVAAGLGVPHTVELNAIFGPGNIPHSHDNVPASYFPGKSNANVVPVIQAYWTSFIRSFDPNAHRLDWSAQWGQYYGADGQPQRLVFQTGGITQMEAVDSKLRQRCAYLQSIGPSVRQKV